LWILIFFNDDKRSLINTPRSINPINQPNDEVQILTYKPGKLDPRASSFSSNMQHAEATRFWRGQQDLEKSSWKPSEVVGQTQLRSIQLRSNPALRLRELGSCAYIAVP
jgi:hypothetical protein